MGLDTEVLSEVNLTDDPIAFPVLFRSGHPRALQKVDKRGVNGENEGLLMYGSKGGFIGYSTGPAASHDSYYPGGYVGHDFRRIAGNLHPHHLERFFLLR